MKIVAASGVEEIAMVYVVDFGDGHLVECVEAVQPPIPREKKWVLLISTMFGCPIKCWMCDAGGFYKGNLSKEQIFAQIDHLVYKRYPDGVVPCAQFKIQFARMGEPSLNPSVLEVLDELPQRYQAPGLMPSFSTIAPASADGFLDSLLEIKNTHYGGGRFQFQFSLHTTDQELRDRITPVRKWSFAQMAEYGARFYQPGDRKLTLNFALAQGAPIEPDVLLEHFDPERFLIKITPLNPTYQAREHGLATYIDPENCQGEYEIVQALRQAGYEVIVSIGEVEENEIGSNCGQYVLRHLSEEHALEGGYGYQVREIAS